MSSRDDIKHLFFAAMDLSPAERAAFLVQSNPDPEVLREVSALIASHEKAGSFMEGSPTAFLHEPALTVGQRLGPYEIEAMIGQGSMGEVYRARDTRLGRPVAIKVLPHAFGRDIERRRRFENEARAASALNHPNVVTLFDVGTVDPNDGSAFLVTELLDGVTLRARLENELPFSSGQALDIARQIAKGLVAAHAAGIIHRDLKPENLFITLDGRVKILDFGIAKFLRSDGRRTKTGAVLGTSGYMAPEQVRGQAVDVRSDIFAFGVVLYEMVTGERAFVGETWIEATDAIVHNDPMQRGVATRLDATLATIVRRCLSKEPSRRYQTAAELLDALERPAPPARTPLPFGHLPTRLVVAGAVVLALIALLALTVLR